MPTPIRAVRVPDDIWVAALLVAKANGETLTAVMRRALETYIRKP